MSTPRDILCAKIAADPLLISAKLEDNLLDFALLVLDNNVDESLRVLKNFAHWHNENLGNPAARVSIVHVHAFYLAKLAFGIPNLVARDGALLLFYRAYADRMGGVPKQFFSLMTMFLFYRIRLPEMNTRWLAITNNENLRFVNLRLTLYKAVNDVGACIPHKKSDPVLYHNSGSFYVKSFTAIKKFVPDFQSSVFTNSEDILKYVDPSMLPMDFGGTVTEEQLEADIEDFIKRQYAIEGLTYSPIDIKNINWKTYRPSGMDFSVRPESAISVKSIDYDAIDAELEAQGYKEEDAAVVE